MTMFKVLAVATALVSASAVAAQPGAMSDSQFFAAKRCQGLMSAKALGPSDSRAIDQVIEAASRARTSAVLDQADQVRADAVRAASHAGAQGRSVLVAERDGACQAFTARVATAGAGGAGGGGR